MKKSIYLPLFLIVLLLFSFISPSFGNNSATVDALSSSARGMIILEAHSGRVLAEKNKDVSYPMASTTKIMTALIALEQCADLDAKIEINSRAVGVMGTSLYLRKGEQLSMRELLYGIMLPSGNDASVAIAYAIAGSEERFIEMMNEKVEKLGLNNTHFANPHGLDEDGHFTSAYDLARITAEALTIPEFQKIVTTKSVVISGNTEVEKRFLSTKNKLLKNNFEGCLGVKTGFTDKAGRCFVSAAERNGVRLVCVVLNCGPMFEESEQLMKSCFEKYKNYAVLNAYDTVGQIAVLNGTEKHISAILLDNFSCALTENEFASLNYVYDFPAEIPAPVAKEQLVGTVKVYLSNDLLFEGNIYTLNSVDSILFQDKLSQILEQWNI